MKTWVKASLWIALLSVFVLVGCQDILDEALKQDVEVKESIVGDQTVTASTGSVPVVSNATSLAKATPVVVEGTHEVHVTPSNYNVFAEMVNQGAVKLVGDANNTNNASGTWKVFVDANSGNSYPSLGNEIASKTFITTEHPINLDQITPSTFFNANPGLSSFYVYLYLDATASITVTSLQFVTPAVAVLTHTIVHDTELMDKGDVESIIGAQIGGSITNNGAASVTLIVSLSDNNAGTSLSWEGEIMNTSVGVGVTLDLAGVDLVVDDTQLNNALTYLAETGDILATITLSSTENVNVNLASIEIVGTATVIPN